MSVCCDTTSQCCTIAQYSVCLAHMCVVHLLQVAAVSAAIESTGLDMLLDVHGDEEIPANVSAETRLHASCLAGCGSRCRPIMSDSGTALATHSLCQHSSHAMWLQ